MGGVEVVMGAGVDVGVTCRARGVATPTGGVGIAVGATGRTSIGCWTQAAAKSSAATGVSGDRVKGRVTEVGEGEVTVNETTQMASVSTGALGNRSRKNTPKALAIGCGDVLTS